MELWSRLISYEWENTAKYIRSRPVAVPYFAVTVTIRCDWMRRTKTMGSHFDVTACRTVSVLRVSAVRFPVICVICGTLPMIPAIMPVSMSE
jgi:hypothetical protein